MKFLNKRLISLLLAMVMMCGMMPMTAFAVENDGSPLDGLNVLCLGDSITAGQGLTTETRWTNVLASKYGWNLTNKSQGGISLSSYYYTANSKTDVSIAKKAEILKTMDTKPDVIIVWGGHNDTSYRYSPMGTWEDETPDSFKGALKHIAELAAEYAPDATLFVLTPLWTTEAPSTLKVPENTTDNNWMFVDAIYEGADIYGWIPVNMDLCGINPFTKSGLLLDNIHPNEAGTEKIVEYLSEELASYGANSKKETIVFNKSDVSIKVGESTTLKAAQTPRSGTGTATFTWSSSDSSVAIVDANGKITAVAPGTATVTATAPNGTTADIKVSVVCDHTYENGTCTVCGAEKTVTPYDQLSTVWPSVNTDLTHIICYGQSFSVGADAPYYADPAVDGVYVFGNITNSTNGTALSGLTGTTKNQHPIVSTGNVFAKLLAGAGIDTDIILGSYGSGGRTIAQLMSAERQTEIKEEDGYTYDILSSGRYEIFQSSVSALAQYAQQNQQSISCPAIVYLQGETDQNTDAQLGYPEDPARAGYGAGGDKEKYKEYMSRLKEDMQREVMEQYGQTEKPLFVIYQVSGTYTRTDYSSINMAQLEFAQENKDVILVQSPYFTSHYTNSHHLTQNGYRWLGEYIGRSLYTALVEREKPWPMLPTSFTVENGNTVRISISGVQNGLTIDTYTVENATDSRNLYGFCLEVDGSRIKPASVTVSGDEIIVTLPQSVNLYESEKVYLIYAGRWANGTGNIRDNCTEVGFYEYLDDSNDTGTGNNQGVSHSSLDANGNSIVGQKYPLYNWLAAFCYEFEVPDVEVPEVVPQQAAEYYWEMQENGLVSITEGNAVENKLTLLQGSIENGVLIKALYSIEKTIVLRHDFPWVLEWKSAGNGNSYPGGKLLSASKDSDSVVRYLYLPADSRSIIAWGVSSESGNFGFKLSAQGIDIRKEHIYRIENRIAEDGVNTVYLIVDGVEIGAMVTGYRTSSSPSGSAGSMMEEPNNWANGRDIYLGYLGEPSNFLLNNMKLSYLKVWENGISTDEDEITGPIITQQPESVQQEVGKKFAITVKAEGEGLTYQWYVKESGAKAFKVSSIKGSTYALTMQKYMIGRQVYCVITDANGNSVQTETATITRPPQALKILEQPKDAQQEIGQKFSISPKVEGEGLTYQWYVKESGAKAFKVSSIKGSTYALTMQKYMIGRQVYCVITDANGNSVQTETATITRPPQELKILEQPADVYASKGEKFSVSPKVQGDGLTYQWYYEEGYMKDFKPSSNITSAYAYSMQTYMNNRQVYCVITDKYGNQVVTEVVTIHLEK